MANYLRCVGRRMAWLTLALTALPSGPALAQAQAQAPASTPLPIPAEGDYTIRDFRFASGEILPELRMHYRTLGTIRRDARGRVDNAVLILHGIGGNGGVFLTPDFAGQLFGPGQLLDTRRYFIIMPDAIGHGGSSKPSNGLKAKFPRFGAHDMIEAQHRALTAGLGVDHLRLILGASMGGSLSWLWGQKYPDYMDALMPLASLPIENSGRNRVWRRILIDAIRNDPTWMNGDYKTQPVSLRMAEQLRFFMLGNATLRQQEMPTQAKADEVLDRYVEAALATDDANDLLFRIASLADYNPGPGLEKIRAPLLAVNTADDLINSAEIGVLEREIKRVPRGRAVVIPYSPQTRGHASYAIAALWKDELARLLAESEPARK